jgi:hypothetical protein
MIPIQKLQIVLNLPKKVPDDIEKDVTGVTGPKAVMGGSEHSQNEFPHNNVDMNANDQFKQGPETEIGTENPNGPESEGTDDDNVGTDVFSPQEGASDDESDEPPVLPSNPPPNGKILAYQKKIGIKKHDEEKKKRKEKKKQKKKEKKQKRNQGKLLPTAKNRTGNLPSRVAGQLLYHMMVFLRTCTTLFKMIFIH